MSNYRICTRCVMDTSDPEIQFDEDGVCNHCKAAVQMLKREPYSLPLPEKKKALEKLVKKIKIEGKDREFDCIIGLSGGVDSSYVAMIVNELGLRPLAVHLDNGWNSEISIKNIDSISKKLDIKVYSYAVNWEEFKDLQLAFLKASTPDSEIPSDHAISALMYKMAKKYKIKYIIAGTNSSSESILPKAWSQGHSDWKYIKNVNKKFSKRKLATFLHINFIESLVNRYNYEWISILDYIDYDKEKAKKIIEEDLGWENYGRKHGESNYTKIFQEYILPVKFGYDKRRAHLSSLIVAGQLSRMEALKQLEEPLYTNKTKEEEDISYLCNKLGITRDEFEAIMEAKPKTMHDYPNTQSSWYYKFARFIYKFFKGK